MSGPDWIRKDLPGCHKCHYDSPGENRGGHGSALGQMPGIHEWQNLEKGKMQSLKKYSLELYL